MAINYSIALVRPKFEFGQSYNEMVQESIKFDGSYPYNNIELAAKDFIAFVQELEDEAQGISIPEDIPAQQTYLLVLDEEVVIGEFRFRPSLEVPYEKYNGHIGYNLHPNYRGKGIGTKALALMLDIARQAGLKQVQIPIEGNNIASKRIAEKNGAYLDKSINQEDGLILYCYQVDL